MVSMMDAEDIGGISLFFYWPDHILMSLQLCLMHQEQKNIGWRLRWVKNTFIFCPLSIYRIFYSFGQRFIQSNMTETGYSWGAESLDQQLNNVSLVMLVF